jgi:hypothetical protein
MRLGFTFSLVLGCDSNSQNRKVRLTTVALNMADTKSMTWTNIVRPCLSTLPCLWNHRTHFSETWHWECSLRVSDRCLWIIGGVITDNYKQKYLGQICSSASWSTTNPTWNVLELAFASVVSSCQPNPVTVNHDSVLFWNKTFLTSLLAHGRHTNFNSSFISGKKVAFQLPYGGLMVAGCILG